MAGQHAAETGAMTGYFLVRESMSMGNAVLAAIHRKDKPEVIDWLTGSAEMEYCLLDDQEFDRARTYRGAIVLTSDLYKGKEIAIAFGPREEWPEEFDRFRNFHEEMERRREDRENITEAKWLGWDDRPTALANFVLPRSNVRKVRLFAVACCDLVADRMVDPRSRREVEASLRHADGAASEEELNAVSREARSGLMSIMGRRIPGSHVADQVSPEYCAAAVACNAMASIDLRTGPDVPEGWLSACAGGTFSDFLIWQTMGAAKDDPFIAAKVTGLLREICGNPFRRVTVSPAWQSPGPTSLARAIYDRMAFDRLPELADALERAGCREPSVLDHCRGPGRHVRGCWVLDLVLGFEGLPYLGESKPELPREAAPTKCPESWPRRHPRS
jgi:hypothetical protein